MINHNELKIGNWIEDSESKRQYQIELVTKNCDELVNPIPLTPEILEACGFQKTSIGYFSIRIDEYVWMYIYPDGIYAFWSDSKECEGDIIRSQDNIIEHLHQLQNLYFALTGIELEVKELV